MTADEIHQNQAISWNGVNDTVLKALSFYCLGPAHKQLEGDVSDSYYIACANGLITTLAFVRGAKCSLSHQLQYIMWMHACHMESAFYESYRNPEVRGHFGYFSLTAFVLSGSPLLIFIVALSAMNYIIMGRVMAKVDEGPTLYHRIEIGCDLILVLISVVPHLESSVIADWLNYVLTGK